jgi:radical SAM superfamily enzyme YgiQ (UPF0313 family)
MSRRAAFPPLGLLTVAAMLPRAWNLRLIDMETSRLRDADIRWADYVMIGGMIVHQESADDVIERCRRLRRPVIAGGPLFTTGHENYAGRVHAVIGEAEDVMADVVRDMESGELKPTYAAAQSFPDVARTPIPRWDLVNLRHYATACVQFSRGCPYDCEFCDIIVMNGRTPRTKSPSQVIAELESLLEAGWRGGVFVVDDNFIGNKKRVKDLLRAMIVWRTVRKPPFEFLTEASVNLAADDELLELMVKAGFRRVFLGIETPVPASLRECNKVQNTRTELAESVRTIQRAGMEVMGGFIVGFDSDPVDIFERQYDFIQRTGIAAAMVGLLTALPKTRLYQRLLGEGRLEAASTGNNTEGSLNFVTKLDRSYLIGGYRRLMRALYEPRAYYQRALVFLGEYRLRGPRLQPTWRDVRTLLKTMWVMGVVHKGRRAFWLYLATVLRRYPRKLPRAVALAVYGFHYRMVAQSL